MTERDKQSRQARFLRRLEERQRRAGLTLGHRLDAMMRKARLISEAPASNYERRSPSADSDEAGPRDSRGLLFEPGNNSLADHFEWRFRVLVESLEREVDAHYWAALTGGPHGESTEDRDSRLLEYRKRGLGPRDILLLDPSQGSVAAIMKAYARLDKKENDKNDGAV